MPPSMPNGSGVVRAAGSRGAVLARGRSSCRAHRRSPAGAPSSTSHRQQHVLRRPEEVDALQEAEEQRRVAQRRQRAADVGDQEDEEDDDVHLVPAVVVGAQQRPDQQHRGAGGAHPAGEHGAERQDAGIDRRRAVQVAASCRMPPATVNSAISRMMKGMYSQQRRYAAPRTGRGRRRTAARRAPGRRAPRTPTILPK